MLKNTVQFFTGNSVFLLGMFFLLLYIGVTKNILDVVYLSFLILCYSRVKYYQWKKYH